jgi:hypothetical protein
MAPCTWYICRARGMITLSIISPFRFGASTWHYLQFQVFGLAYTFFSSLRILARQYAHALRLPSCCGRDSYQ